MNYCTAHGTYSSSVCCECLQDLSALKSTALKAYLDDQVTDLRKLEARRERDAIHLEKLEAVLEAAEALSKAMRGERLHINVDRAVEALRFAIAEVRKP